MPPIASQRQSPRSETSEAGFSLTELIAGLLVASLLVIGLIDITSRYARTASDIRSTVLDLRTDHLLHAMFSELERADPGSITLSSLELKAQVGGEEIVGRIETAPGGRVLHWSSARQKRVFDLPQNAHFAETEDGIIQLTVSDQEPPVASVVPRRTIPFDCQFDTLSRKCRT